MTPIEISKHRVLVVDDDATVRESLTMLLTAEGYEVNSAVNGFDALLQLKTSTPDVITSDLNMPQNVRIRVPFGRSPPFSAHTGDSDQWSF